MSTGELKGEKPPIIDRETQLSVFARFNIAPDDMENPAPEIDDALCEAQRDDTWQKATLIYEAKFEQVKRDIFNKTVHAAEHRERFVIERAKAEMAKEIKDALENYWDSAKNRYWLKKEEMQSLIAKYGVEQ